MKSQWHHRLAALLAGLSICLIGSGNAVVAYGSAELSDTVRKLVEEQALAAASLQVSPPDRFTVLSCRCVSVDPLPQSGALRIEPLEVDGPNRSGIVRVRFRMLVDGQPMGEAHGVVRGKVRGPVLVVRETLKIKEPISADQVEVSDEDLTRLNDAPLRRFEEIAGRVPVRTLGPDRLLTPALLRTAPLVRRGETVLLKIERPHLTLTAKGTVLVDGAEGEKVRARNNSTGVEVTGLVLPDGTVLVSTLRDKGRSR